MFKIERVSIEHQQEALGIGSNRPRISWQVETDTPNWQQAAYEIQVHTADGKLRGETGRTESNQSVLVAWSFTPLTSRERVNVRVRVWGMDGQSSNWSEPIPVEAGLLGAGDWSARFITPAVDEDTSKPQPVPLLRREFEVRAPVQHARLYVTALGVYEAQLNGQTIGDHIMPPGWTSYHHRLRYQTFDVTDLLHEGRNAIGAIVGDGWFRGRLGYHGGRRNIYGDRVALLAQLEITYADGTTEKIVTDESWHAATGPIRASDIYDGETYDARLERDGWSQAGYRDDDWQPVRTVEWNHTTLVAPLGPPVRRTQELAPVSIFKSPSGRTLVDFGQNLVGRLRVTAQGPAGQTITLRHAEVLENGELGTRPLRLVQATDRYTLRGNGIETFEPRFTFHGFRYAEIENYPGDVRAQNICAVVCHSDMERTGWFECSDSLLNRLHENVVWSMRGNFFDVPTDCPQRDERLGWTGDIQVFSPTATFLYDSCGFLQSWLADLTAEQKALGGMVPQVVPNAAPGAPRGAAAWGDAAVIVPWVLYQRFGDPAILSAQFESMRSWVDWIARTAGDAHLWSREFQFGDWLDPVAPPDFPGNARADRYLVATAYFARSAELVADAAGFLGLEQEQAHYRALADQIRRAFQQEYVTPAGRLMSDAQTAYTLALEFGLLANAEQRHHAAERLAALVRANGYRIGTGFVGTPLICDALCSAGEYDVAYRLLMEHECPSWLYPVTMGATTIWERWDSMLPDGSINPGEMTSFNHYALGGVADWMHRIIGGIAPVEPGYRRIGIAPQPGGGLTHGSARHRTPYGMAECSWTIGNGSIELHAVVPPNTTALVSLPGKEAEPLQVGSGHHSWSYAYRVPDSREPLNVNSTLAELRANPRAWAVVREVLESFGPQANLSVLKQSAQGNLTLRQGLDGFSKSNVALVKIAQELADL